jgi:methionyl-tRNA formyltransferase
MKAGLKIIFMGTPDFAKGVLQEILESTHEVLAVVTAPDRPAGRGQKLRKSAVKIHAEQHDIPILQPEKLKADDFINNLKTFDADLYVVVAFRMLPELVWSIPSKGTINLHASLLPNYRGAAPINWAIMNGEKTTGITTFFINDKIDTGDILKQNSVDITKNMNAGMLHDVLMKKGAELIVETLEGLEKGILSREEQMDLAGLEIKHAPKIFKSDCQINWSDNRSLIHDKIRGLSPYPGAWSILYNKVKKTKVQFKFFSSSLETNETVQNRVNLKLGAHGILFPCNNGFLEVSELQMEGKRRMHYKEFLAGNALEDFEIFTA